MNRKAGILAASILFSIFVCRACLGIEPTDLSKASEFWQTMESLRNGHYVSYSRIENGDLYETGEYIRQNDFVLVSSHGVKENDVKFVNPNYRATIAKRIDESWRIRWIGTDQAVLSEAEDRSIHNMFVVQICDPGGVQSVFADPNLAQDLRMQPDGNGLVYKVVSKLPDGAKLHVAYQDAEVRLFGPLDSFPKMCEVMYQGGKGTRLEYSELENVNGVLIPSIVKATFIDAFGAEGSDPSEYRFVYSKFTSPLDSERCYLRHYGLPEPSSTSGSRLAWVYVLSTVAFVGLVLAIKAWRGKTRS